MEARYHTAGGASSTLPLDAIVPRRGFQPHPPLWYKESWELSRQERDELIGYLSQLVKNLDGPDPVRWEESGIVEEFWPGDFGKNQGRDRTQDVARFRICKELMWSNPIRLSEGLEHIEWLIAHIKKYGGKEVTQDPVLCIYLGGALEMRGEQEARALRLLSTPGLFRDISAKNELFGRACLSRLLRKVDREEEAVAQEKLICDWIRGHPYEMLPSAILNQICVNGDTNNSIVDRLGKDHFAGYTELSDSRMRVPGNMIITINRAQQQPHDIFSFRPLEANKWDKHECWVSGCRTTSGLSKCSGCKTSLYCCQDHQKKAWPRHKQLCKDYARANTD